MICIQFAYTCREPARFLSFQETQSFRGFSVPLTPQTHIGPEPPVLTEDPLETVRTWGPRKLSDRTG